MPHDQTVAVAKKAPPRKHRGLIILLLTLIILAGLVARGIEHRRTEAAKLERWTDERAIASVAVISPHLDTSPHVFTLPGRIAAFYDADIDAQVVGYIKEWRKDIGAIVKKGEILAVIDTPELDQQIAKAREDIAHAKAAEAMADLTAQRWDALRSTPAVSQQSIAEKESDSLVKQADVRAAEAELQRLLAKKDFANVVAPFDGVVTARNIDIGSFVDVSDQSQPLFKVADIHAVRVYVSAPENYAMDLLPGAKATLLLKQHPDRVFDATIVTTSNSIELKSRTLLVELNAPNPDRLLLPGEYAEVRFSLPSGPKNELRIPASALVVDKNGDRVATIENGRAHFKNIVVAHDYGVEIEVASGLSPNERIIDNPGDTLAEGDEVRVDGASADPARPDAGAAPSQ